MNNKKIEKPNSENFVGKRELTKDDSIIRIRELLEITGLEFDNEMFQRLLRQI